MTALFTKLRSQIGLAKSIWLSPLTLSAQYLRTYTYFFIVAALMTVPPICQLINLSAAIYGKHWVFEQYMPLAVTEHTGVTELQVIITISGLFHAPVPWNFNSREPGVVVYGIL
ncbi:hypothetical protein K439DRAFT_1628574 [Ramaria rubella]|nr:hypothetical protein K439DRAFT_1628574 [Ramaria rubella]